MLLDKQNTFHDNVTLAAGANNGDVVDMGAATNLGAMNSLGSGPVEVFVKIGTKANADNTIALAVEAADDAAFTVNKITVASLAATNVAAGGTAHLAIGHHAPKRYFRVVVTTAGTAPSINNAKVFLNVGEVQRSLAGLGLI